MKIKTCREIWEDEILKYKELIKYFQSIIDDKPIEIKALKFIDPEDSNIQEYIDSWHEYDDSLQDTINSLLSNIKDTKTSIANFDYWERNKDTKKILQKATKEIKKLIKDKIKLIEQEKPENIFTPLKRSVDTNFLHYPYIIRSIYFYEDSNPQMKQIDEEFTSFYEEDTEYDIYEYAHDADEGKSYIDEYKRACFEFENNWIAHKKYIEAFLSLPAEYIWTKYFHPLKNIKKYFGDDVIQIFHSQSDYDYHDQPAFTSQKVDPRISAWVRWYKVNVLKLGDNC